MEKKQRALVIDLALKRISTESFVAEFGVDPRTDHEFVREELGQALNQKSADDVGCAMLLAFLFGFSRSWAPLLGTLLCEDWHHSHEDIASVLQDIRDSSTVDALYETALKRHPYLDYDDAFVLAVKCIWALHDIGTTAAQEKLVLLSQSKNIVISGSADTRLKELIARRAAGGDAPYRSNSRVRPD